MPRVVYLCSDLLFVSKIRETAAALGHAAIAARDPAGLLAAVAAAEAGDVVAAIVDLRRPDALEALEALAGAGEAGPLTVGFCDHERVERMDEARARGCDRVLAKGKFSSELRHLLAPSTAVAAAAPRLDPPAGAPLPSPPEG